DVLQKLVEGATEKKAAMKPIKGISGLKVMELRAAEVALWLSPGVGVSMAVPVRMTLTGKSFIGGKMEIPMAANLSTSSRMVQDMQGCPRLSAGRCHVALLHSWAKLPPSHLPADAIPLGNAGMLRYALLNAPMVREAFIQLELKVRCTHSTTHGPNTDPGTATQLILAAGFLSAELSVMQAFFGLNITNGMVGHAALCPSQTTDGASQFGAFCVLLAKVTQPPLVTITPEKSTVHLFSTAEFWASSPGSAPGSLFVLDVHSELGVRFAVAEETLRSVCPVPPPAKRQCCRGAMLQRGNGAGQQWVSRLAGALPSLRMGF
uniref:Lipid-binding serum glycoprotein N-terminal domain-containing protein n=1 Tax=Pavo cristatus TaxID=9049 RepID=A0A8C9EMS8_PAVCR